MAGCVCYCYCVGVRQTDGFDGLDSLDYVFDLQKHSECITLYVRRFEHVERVVKAYSDSSGLEFVKSRTCNGVFGRQGLDCIK